MSDKFVLTCDAEPVETGFVPTARITRGDEEVFSWRCTFAFTEKSTALVYARGYGEVALESLKLRR